MYMFATGELTRAGEYAATAEYSEARTELARALPRKDLTLRSPSCALQAASRQTPMPAADSTALSVTSTALHAMQAAPQIHPCLHSGLFAAQEPSSLPVSHGFFRPDQESQHAAGAC